MSLANQSTLTQMLELTEDSNYNCIPIFKKLNRAEGFHKWCLEAFQNLSKDGKGLYLTEMEVRCLPLPETGHSPGYLSSPESRGHFPP